MKEKVPNTEQPHYVPARKGAWPLYQYYYCYGASEGRSVIQQKNWNRPLYWTWNWGAGMMDGIVHWFTTGGRVGNLDICSFQQQCNGVNLRCRDDGGIVHWFTTGGRVGNLDVCSFQPRSCCNSADSDDVAVNLPMSNSQQCNGVGKMFFGWGRTVWDGNHSEISPWFPWFIECTYARLNLSPESTE